MRYTPAAVEAAASLSSRYIQDRFLPDKAIDLIDEAGARARIAPRGARRSRFAPRRPVSPSSPARWSRLPATTT